MKRIRTIFRQLQLGEEGATAMEYAVLVSAIVGGLIASLGIWGNFLQTLWQNATAQVFR